MLHQSAYFPVPITGNRAIYLRWVVLLVLVPFFVHSNALVQGHFLPKIGAMALLSAAMSIILFLRARVWLPQRGVLFGFVAWFTLSAVSGAFSVSPWLSYLNTGVAFSAFLLFLFLLNIQRRTTRLLMGGIIVSGFIQFLTLVKVLPWHYSTYDPEGRWTGTLGNSEFLATLLGCGVFCSLYFMRLIRVRWQKAILLAGIAVLLVGLALTGNKGAFFLITAYLLWLTYDRRLWPWLLLGVACIVVAAFFPSAILGRIFLFITGLAVFVAYPLFGVGAGQLSNHYIEAVQNIFSHFPMTVTWFGAHTATARDVHNLLLSFGLELGIGGFVLGGLFLWYGFWLCRPLHHPLRGGLAFLLIKSLYTVVVSSGTGAILLAVFLAAAMPRRWIRQATMPVAIGAGQVAAALFVIFLIGAWIASDLHLRRGIKFMVLGEQNSARAELKVALKANPENAEAWLTLGEIEFLDRDTTAMELALNKAVFFMRDMDTYKKSAHMYFFSNDYQKAFPLYSSLLTAYPEHLTSMARLVQIYEAAGDHASARGLAMRLLRTVPRVPSNSDLRNVQVACSLLYDLKNNYCPRGAL